MAKTKTHAIPYLTIASLYAAGKSMAVIAKAVHLQRKGTDDPTHYLRAILSRMRTQGFSDGKGQRLQLKGKRLVIQKKEAAN